MEGIKVNISVVNEYITKMENGRDTFLEEQAAITDANTEGMGKVADALQENKEVSDSILCYLRELYARSITVLKYLVKTMEELEQATAESLQPENK